VEIGNESQVLQCRLELSHSCYCGDKIQVTHASTHIISGLEENGLYRVVGVNSKVNKLIQLGLGKIFVFLYCISGNVIVKEIFSLFLCITKICKNNKNKQK
jgi:hypothetical protein